MLSDSQLAQVYFVQVRYSGATVEQVSGMEYPSLSDAVGAANRLSAWLRYGHGCHLPEDAIDLRGDLEAAGLDPADVAVEVAYPDARAPHGHAVACLAMAVDDDDAGEGLADTVIIVGVGAGR